MQETESPSRQFSVWRVLLAVIVVVALFMAPFVWLKLNEEKKRAEVTKNLQQISQAIQDYEAKRRGKLTPKDEPEAHKQPSAEETAVANEQQPK
jgi:hypothetical protein